MASADSNLVNSNIKDIIGQRFGRLVVLRFSHVGKTWKVAYWFCQCDCGGTCTVAGKHLRSHAVQSCGCLVIERATKMNYQHGRSSRSHPQRYLVELWNGIIKRCYMPACRSFRYYGARGITIADEWRCSSKPFTEYVLAVLGERPTKDHSLDRINNSLGYAPGNLRWVTTAEQNRNKRTTRLITAGGRTQCLADWAKELGRNPRTISARIDELGWSEEEAVEAIQRATAITSPLKLASSTEVAPS